MGEKDVTEKILEDYNDIFADIVNVLVYDGKEVVKPDKLQNAAIYSHYRNDKGRLREQERDVVKYWTEKGMRIVLYGIENQTVPEKRMPVRVFGYEGASYRSQLTDKRVAPVITMVLYFGIDKHWNEPKNLKNVIEVPDELKSYVNDVHINVFEIAWLTEEQISRFTSDFKVVANFFVNKRKNKDYIPDDNTTIKHVDEVLKLLSVMTGDRRYEKLLGKSEGVSNMCDVAQRLEDRGIAKGRIQGRVEGRAEERNLLSDAIHRLKAGEQAEELIASGIDKETVEVALTCL